MKFFTKNEIIAVSLILLFIFVISLFNFNLALRRGRDNERKNDLSDIKRILGDYHAKFNAYPKNLDELSSLVNVVPKDPSTPSGYSYLYFTDGKDFQLFASLEGKDEAEYSTIIYNRKLMCGKFICNFGLASGNAPLDKTLEEYENEINAKLKK